MSANYFKRDYYVNVRTYFIKTNRTSTHANKNRRNALYYNGVYTNLTMKTYTILNI